MSHVRNVGGFWALLIVFVWVLMGLESSEARDLDAAGESQISRVTPQTAFLFGLGEPDLPPVVIELMRPLGLEKMYQALYRALEQQGIGRADPLPQISPLQKCVVIPSVSGRYQVRCVMEHDTHYDTLTAQITEPAAVLNVIRRVIRSVKYHSYQARASKNKM